jgi:hypothetical protein
VPAAAVIPAPIAYIKVVAVKKLVVEFLPLMTNCHYVADGQSLAFLRFATALRDFTLSKLECFKQAFAWILQHGIIR